MLRVLLAFIIFICHQNITNAQMDLSQINTYKLELIKENTDFKLFAVPDESTLTENWEMLLSQNEGIVEFYYVDMQDKTLDLIILEGNKDSTLSKFSNQNDYKIVQLNGQKAYFSDRNELRLEKEGTYITLASSVLTKQELFRFASRLKEVK